VSSFGVQNPDPCEAYLKSSTADTSALE